MKAPEVITLDYETYPIGRRGFGVAEYPPEPVGLATKWPGQRSNYLAWGHSTNNNATYEDGLAELERVYDSGLPILCHHSKFDLAVATERMGMPMVPWERIHDTVFLAYLLDPHSKSGGPKDLAEEMLQWPPEEQDKLQAWIMGKGPALLAAHAWNKKTPGQIKITKTDTGRWIWAAPGDLAGSYAKGDTDRTEGLFNYMWPVIQERELDAAYVRERRVMPILMENERLGMLADLPRLERDIPAFRADFDKAEDWLRRELHASGLNFDADQDLAAVLMERGIVPHENWTMTAKGNSYATNKDALRPEHFTGPNGDKIASVLGYRNRLRTCLSMFMEPWAEQARGYGGYITTNWNQVRDPNGGTRTGRPSTDKHNFLNISKDFESKRDDGYVHPAWLGVLNLPLCRKYVLPDPGQTFQHRDFDGQEMRVFAHFESGDLWEQFNANPDLDPHEFIGEELMRVAQREIERTRVKTLNFQGLYGGGIPALQNKLRCSAAEAKQLKQFHDGALPGRKILNEEIKRIINAGYPIRTVGGRLYFKEPNRVVEGRMRDFLYKLINYLIQGSAADLTKEALIHWHERKSRNTRFLVTVYDEINISTDPGEKEKQMSVLRESMELPRLTVPMKSSGKEGPTWGDLVKCP